MPNLASGERAKRNSDGSFSGRVTLLGKKRKTYPLPTCTDQDAADARRELLASLASKFRKAGKIDDPGFLHFLDKVAEAPAYQVPAIEPEAQRLLSENGAVVIKKSAPTFEQVGKEWTSGELHKKWEDHVRKKKDAEQDASRLKKLCETKIDGIRAGDIPIDQFRLRHAEAMMRGLPKEAQRPATRRQYALLISRVCSLAVYPCAYLAASPLPKGFLPKPGKPPEFPFIYPREDAALLGHTKAPLCYRILFGFLVREGCRRGEAYSFQVRDFDLDAGDVTLSVNKTDDPRSWALDPGVRRALKAWVKRRNAKPDDFMFVDEDENALTEDHKLADRLRAFLLEAGQTRHVLHTDGKNRGKLRVHDLRGTFVTLALANGKSETWVADRTGHTTSDMINGYRRQARKAEELRLGELLPLDMAIPELAEASPEAPPPPTDGPAEETSADDGGRADADSSEESNVGANAHDFESEGRRFESYGVR